MPDPIDRLEPITHKEAREMLSRFNASHWGGRAAGEKARYTIPADPRRDDDIRLGAYIDQQEKREAAFQALLAERAAYQNCPAMQRITTCHPDDGYGPLRDAMAKADQALAAMEGAE